MRVPILRSICTKLTNFENMQKSYVLLHHVTQKRYVVRHGGWNTSGRYFRQEHFATNQKSLGSTVMAQTVVFMIYVTLTFGICSIFITRTTYLNFHAKFHKNRSSING